MTTFFLLIIRLVPLFLILWSGFYLHIGGGGIFKSFNRALWPMLEFSLRLSRRLNPRPTSNIDPCASDSYTVFSHCSLPALLPPLFSTTTAFSVQRQRSLQHPSHRLAVTASTYLAPALDPNSAYLLLLLEQALPHPRRQRLAVTLLPWTVAVSLTFPTLLSPGQQRLPSLFQLSSPPTFTTSRLPLNIPGQTKTQG